MKKMFSMIIVAALMVGLSLTAQAEVVIDNFDYLQQTLGPIGSSSNIEQGAVAPTGNTIGDYRYVLLSHEDGPNNVNALVDSASDPNAFRFETESSTRGFVLIDWYNFTDSDFEAEGERIDIDIISHGGQLTYTFEAFTDGSGSSTLSRDYNLGVAGTLSFAFTNFSGSADFTDVDRLTLKISNETGLGTSDADTTIDQIGVVPEPTSFALLVIGLLTTRLYRRKVTAFLGGLKD